jgi:Cu(I)/Ag(I) efflux system membrane fusion protein
MAVTTGRAVAAVIAGVVVVAALVYTIRSRPQHSPAQHDAVAPASRDAGMADGTGPTAVPRGDVTIDTQRQQLLGVRLSPVTREPMAASVRTTGIVKYDETRLTDVNVKLDGWIRDLHVDYTGQVVQKGQPLFTLYSPDLMTTQQEYLLALKTRERVAISTIADAREYADRVVDAARERLRLWDLSPDDIAALDESKRVPDTVAFRSPVSGFVLEKQAIRGMHVTPGQTLYKIADLSSVWIEADVYEREIALARVGQRATVRLDAYPGESFEGRATYIYPFVEENSRTVKVRFQFANPRGRLKPGMYANVEMKGDSGMALTVPADALLDSGTDRIVFVARGQGSFTPRTVVVGRRFGSRVEIAEGLEEGEQVASGATFFLDSESQLRAGLQSYEPAPSTASVPPAEAAQLNITFRAQPDPPTTGENVFEVTVKDRSGQPVSDADVSAQLFMPAMPTMNMPAMRNEAKLPSAGGGVYRGPGQVLMGGTWDVTVSVKRAGQEIGSRKFSLVAR